MWGSSIIASSVLGVDKERINGTSDVNLLLNIM